MGEQVSVDFQPSVDRAFTYLRESGFEHADHRMTLSDSDAVCKISTKGLGALGFLIDCMPELAVCGTPFLSEFTQFASRHTGVRAIFRKRPSSRDVFAAILEGQHELDSVTNGAVLTIALMDGMTAFSGVLRAERDFRSALDTVDDGYAEKIEAEVGEIQIQVLRNVSDRLT
jgi:hypothetical protein